MKLRPSLSLCLALAAGCGGVSYSPRYDYGAASVANSANGYGSAGAYGASGYRPNAGYTQPGAYPQPSANTPPAPLPPVSGDTNAQVQNIDRYMRTVGYSLLGNVVQQPTGPGGYSSLPLAVQPGQCYLVFVLGDGASRNANLQVSSPTGRVVARYPRRDAHPSVAFCATEFGAYLARLSIPGPPGSFVIGLYQGPPGAALPNLATVWGDAAPPSQADNATASRISTFTRDLLGQGYRLASSPTSTLLQQGQTTEWAVTLTGNTCYTFAAFGGQNATDVDLFLSDPSNQLINNDAQPNQDAFLRDVCVEQSGPYRLRSRMTSGAGPAWLAVYTRPRAANAPNNPAPGNLPDANAQSQAVALNLGAQATSGGDLETLFRDLEQDFGVRGYRAAPGAPQSGQLATGAETTLQFNADANACYAVAAGGSDSAENLDLEVLTAGNQLIDRDRSNDNTPVVRFCAQQAGPFSARLRMAAGQGAWRVRLFRWQGGISGAGLSGLLFLRNAEVTRVLGADNFQGDANFELYRGRLRRGGNVTRSVTLEAGQCYAFVAVGGDGLSSLNLQLQQGNSTVAQDPAASAFPAARYCARTGGAYRVQIRNTEGEGDVVFRVFRQQGGTRVGGN